MSDSDSDRDDQRIIVNQNSPLLFSVRFRLCLLLSTGFALVYALRVNLSIAIVAMVKDHSNPNPISNDTQCYIPNPPGPNSNSSSGGSYDWDAGQQGYILGAFFYGYIITQIPGGFLADKFGARVLLSAGMLCTSFLTLFTAIVADWGPNWLIVLRILEGLGEGVTYPAAASFWARWAPAHERSRMIGFCFAGAQMGTVLAIPLTGLLIEISGWPSVFYWFGGVGCVWCLVFFLYARNSPSEFKGLSKAEKEYILKNRTLPDKMPPIPWKKFATCAPLWATLAGHVSFNWGFYVLFTCLPKYLKEVLGFDMKHNAIFSALPYLIMWISINFATNIADQLIINSTISKTNVRKIFQSLSEFPPAILMGLIPFFGCQSHAVITVICLCCMFKGCMFAAVNVNHADLAPAYTGLLFGITNMMANIPGFLAPEMVGAFTVEESSIETWSRVWYTSAAIYFVGAIIYIFFASAELQPWAAVSESRSRARRDSDEPERAGDDRQPLLQDT